MVPWHDRHFDWTFVLPCGLARETAPENPQRPGIPESPSLQGLGTGVIPVLEMLLQDYPDELIVLPCWPDRVPVDFTLYSPYAGRVEVHYRPANMLRVATSERSACEPQSAARRNCRSNVCSPKRMISDERNPRIFRRESSMIRSTAPAVLLLSIAGLAANGESASAAEGRVFHVARFWGRAGWNDRPGRRRSRAIAAAVAAAGTAEAPVEVVLDAGTYRVRATTPATSIVFPSIRRLI